MARYGNLNKALYGLKQAPRAWYLMLKEALQKFGLESSSADGCLWVSKTAKLAILVIVDDMAVAGDAGAVEAVISYLENTFKMKRLGDIGTFVGLNCERDRAQRQMIVHQHRYTTAILKRFNLDNCRPVTQPIDVSVKFHKAMEGEERVDPAKYQSMIGSVMFLMLGSRPDLAYGCGLLARYSKEPTVAHAKALERMFRYIQGTKDFKLHLGGNEDLSVLRTQHSLMMKTRQEVQQDISTDLA